MSNDVGDWIGASQTSVYNFSPEVRPVPLDIRIQTFDTNHVSSRILAMGKSVFEAICKHAPNTPAIVFVPSKKQAQLSAIDILTYAAATGRAGRFLDSSRMSEAAIADALSTIKDRAVAQVVAQGVGYLHTGMNSVDIGIVESLVKAGVVQALVVPHVMCWSLSVSAQLVVVMDTVYYEGREGRFVDYSISDLLQMIGKASRQNVDMSSRCVVLCHTPKRDNLKKLLHDPLPVESHLDHYLHDHLNAEVVTKTIENKPDAVDYLTWTFYYRRLLQNPNYYNLLGVTHRHLSDHLSELIETTIGDLEESKCLAVEGEIDLLPLNLGMIASYYYIEYTTIELFASSVTAKTKVKGVVEILSASSEFSHLAIRQGEENIINKLSMRVANQPMGGDVSESCSTKASILLQCHFGRLTLSSDLVTDQESILTVSVKLLQALVDVISSQGWLRPALAAMEVSQMVVQGIWNKDSVLMQVPHFNIDLVRKLADNSPPVETVFDLLDLDEEARSKLLKFTPNQLSDIAKFCNAYPNVELSYSLSVEGEVGAGEPVVLNVELLRDCGEEQEENNCVDLGRVVCPRFPSAEKRDCW